MKSVSKGKLKAQMLEYFREVERTGEELVVTDHNVPVLRIVPFQQQRWTAAEAFQDLRAQFHSSSDLTEPTDSEWSKK